MKAKVLELLKKRRKCLRRLFAGVAVLAAILIVLSLLIPRLVSLDSIENLIKDEVSGEIGGRFDFSEAAIVILPRPGIIVNGVELAVPGVASGTARSVKVYPELIPLLSGEIRLAKIRLDTPDFSLTVPEDFNVFTEETESAPSPGDQAKMLSLLLAPLAQKTPDLSIEINKGVINVRTESETAFTFRDIEAEIYTSPGDLDFRLACTSNLWKMISVKGSLSPESLHGDARMKLISFKPHLLLSRLFPNAPWGLEDSQVDTNLEVSMETAGLIKGQLRTAAARLVPFRGSRKVIIEDVVLNGTFRMSEEGNRFHVKEFAMRNPRLSLSGGLTVKKDPKETTLDLSVKDLDLPGLREKALEIAGDIQPLDDVFSILKDGEITKLNLSARGNSMVDLAELENITVEGGFQKARVSVPEVEIELEEMCGDITVSKGVLSGENLKALAGNSGLSEGTLSLSLKDQSIDAPFNLSALIDADVAEIPPILERLIDDREILENISSIESLKGRVKTRLLLDGSLESIEPSLDVLAMNFSAEHRLIPYPISIKGGQGGYKGKNITLKNVSGSIGHSSFYDVAAELGMDVQAPLKVTSGSLSVSLDEVMSWLASMEKPPDEIRSVEKLSGVITVSVGLLQGPLLHPKEWNVKASAAVKDVTGSVTYFKEPVQVTEGKFNLDTERFSFSAVQVKHLDTTLGLSGYIHEYRSGPKDLELSVSGILGEQVAHYLLELTELQSDILPGMPLTIKELRFNHKDGLNTVKGQISGRTGNSASFDGAWSEGQLTVRRLRVSGSRTNAEITAHLKGGSIDVGFSGTLSDFVLDKYVKGEVFAAERLNGDFKAHVEIEQPELFTATGRLEGKGLVFPLKDKSSLAVNSFTVDAKGKTIEVESVELTFGETHAFLNGRLSRTSEGLMLMANVEADRIKLDEAQAAFEAPGEVQTTDEQKTEPSRGLPLLGEIKLKSDSLIYDRYTWSPFNADISLQKSGVILTLKEGVLCNIQTPGVLALNSENLDINISLDSRGQDLEAALTCLLGRKSRMTGTFDLNGKLTAKGKPETLLNSLGGRLVFSSKDGEVRDVELVARIFALLNTPGLLKGKVPDYGSEGLPYQKLMAKAAIKDGKILLEESAMAGVSTNITGQGKIDVAAREMDILLLVAPLAVVNTILDNIPLFKSITGGNIISVPVRINGGFDKPNVRVASPTAVGSKMIDIMKNTLKFPVKVIEKVPLGTKKKEESDKVPDQNN